MMIFRICFGHTPKPSVALSVDEAAEAQGGETTCPDPWGAKVRAWA